MQRLQQRTPVILTTAPNDDYALIDSGNGLKLEQYGPCLLVRPEGQAVWTPSLSPDEWQKAQAVFTGDTSEDGIGRWHFPHGGLGETWPMAINGTPFLGRFTSFRHVGVFPEQAAHWSFAQDRIAERCALGMPVRLLNLFGYTGVASLAAARAGAQVTHVDASKKAIGWARKNQDHAGLQHAPIRWICDDAMKFCAREVRRGQTYHGILLDPPAYGRGPKGEVWQLFDNLPEMLSLCRALLAQDALFMVLTAYAIRSSFYAMHELMQEALSGTPGYLESGELLLQQRHGGRVLSTSMFSRWIGGKP